MNEPDESDDSDDSSGSNIPVPNTPFTINLGGDRYTNKNRFKTVYKVNDTEADQLASLFDLKGIFREVPGLTEEVKTLVLRALEGRIKNINEQLSSDRKNILIYQPLGDIQRNLQKIVNTLKNGPKKAAVPLAPPSAIKKIPHMDTNLMSFLLRIGYAITHSERIPTGFIDQWNKFVNATTELTGSDGLINIETPVVNEDNNPVILKEDDSFTISKNTFLKAGENSPYTKVSDYLKAMTAVSNSQKAFTSQIGATISALYTYQFIQESEKKAFEKKNTKQIETILPSITKRLQTRFSNSMANILQYYKKVLGPILYATINSKTFLEVFIPPKVRNASVTTYFPVQEGLRMIEGILEKIYTKLYSTTIDEVYNALGIYKLNKDDSAKLIPFLNSYRETARGKTLHEDVLKEQFKLNPFIWFQLGSDIPPQTIITGLRTLLSPGPGGPFPVRTVTTGPTGPTGSTGSTDTELMALATTFDNFIGVDKAKNVFMMVQNTFPSPNEASSYFALLHTYGEEKESEDITTWNKTLLGPKKFTPPVGQVVQAQQPSFVLASAQPIGPSAPAIGGPRLTDIGMSQWPLYALQTHLSLPILQCMTFLAATNQTSEKTKRYENLVLPIP